MEKTEREKLLEEALRQLWDDTVAAWALNRPTDAQTQVFVKTDAKLRELGILPPVVKP